MTRYGHFSPAASVLGNNLKGIKMSNYTGKDGLGVEAFQSTDRVSTTTTSWGYVVRTRDKNTKRSAVIERMCLVAGVSLIIPGAWHWVLPGVESAFTSTSDQMLTVVSIMVAGLLFFWISVRGLREEVHVDRSRGQLRVMAVNRNGQTRPKSVIPFDQIESAFLKRHEEYQPAQLYLRLKKGVPVCVASGDIDALETLTTRMTQDFGRTELPMEGWERVGRKLVRAGA